MTTEEVSKSIEELKEEHKYLKEEIEIVGRKLVEIQEEKSKLFVTAMMPLFLLLIFIIFTGLYEFVGWLAIII